MGCGGGGGCGTDGGCSNGGCSNSEGEDHSQLLQRSSFRDGLYTIDQSGNRKWVYCETPSGRLISARRIVAYILLAVLILTPWIDWPNAQGVWEQAVLIDLTGRKLHLFGIHLWATDTIFLMLLLGMAGITLFFVTSLFGRVWCGWACPETIFLEHVFRPIERLIEGNATKRKKLDEAPWTLSKLQKKLLKHGLFAGCAWIIATSFLAYFYGAKGMIVMITDVPWHHPYQFFLTTVFMGFFAFQFGWFREQFCTVVCPYARFQSVLLDKDSIVVGYDTIRGEPRGKKGTTTGDCVDCGACVRVCPTGIDIRNGLQLECVNCTACIDACNDVMVRLDRPQGLIRYSSERELTERSEGGVKRGAFSHLLRPRTAVYGTILTAYLVGFFLLALNRKPFDFALIRAHDPFSTLSDGRISNQLQLKIANKSGSSVKYFLSTKTPGVELITPINPVPLPSGEQLNVPAFANFEQPLVGKKVEITVQSGEYIGGTPVTTDSATNDSITRDITLLGPEKKK